MKRYPKYKDSGVPWLGQVPAHWEVKKVKHMFRHLKVINRGMVCEDRLALTMSGVVPRALDDAEGLQTEDYSNYQIVDRNDLLFKLIDLQNIRTSRVGHVPSRGIVSPAYIRLKSHAAVDVRFSYWYFMSIYVRDIFNTMGAGVRQSLTQSDLLELPFLLPSAPEMSAVAVYLDRVTLEIDSAISSQERMIELLKERRSAVITQAVTKGLDLKAKMKDSGVPWLGQVPEHWEVIEPKRKMKSRSGGILIKGKCHDQYADGLFPAFSASGQDVWVENCDYSIPGLVLSAVGARCGKTFKAQGQWSVVANTHCLFPEDTVDLTFVWYVTNLDRWWDTGGSAQPFVKVRSTLAKKWVFPPLEEQVLISKYLDDVCVKFDALVEAQTKLIELLKERRSAIITQAVTGQIDVR